MEPLTLYRKRLIPNETILLDRDELLFHDGSLLVTRWKTIRPKDRLSHGLSCYYLQQGFKVSQFYDHQDQLMYWYCDIIETSWDEVSHAYTFTDLLADMIVRPDGSVHVVDLDELAQALEERLISQQQACAALRRLQNLIQIAESGDFPRLLKPLKEYESL